MCWMIIYITKQIPYRTCNTVQYNGIQHNTVEWLSTLNCKLPNKVKSYNMHNIERGNKKAQTHTEPTHRIQNAQTHAGPTHGRERERERRERERERERERQRDRERQRQRQTQRQRESCSLTRFCVTESSSSLSLTWSFLRHDFQWTTWLVSWCSEPSQPFGITSGLNITAVSGQCRHASSSSS